jgi:hypothetical protein
VDECNDFESVPEKDAGFESLTIRKLVASARDILV